MVKAMELWPKKLSAINDHIKNSIQTLNGLWEEMGLPEEWKTKRMDLVELHCRDLFQRMVEEEKERKSRLIAEVKRLTDEVRKRASELEEDIQLKDEGKPLMVAKDKLKLKLKSLVELRLQRLNTYRGYKAKDKFLSYRLGTDEYPSCGESEIPNSTYLGDFKKDLDIKQTKLDSVEKWFKEKRSVIINLMLELEVDTTTTCDSIGNMAERDESSIPLTKDFMTSVERRHQELVEELESRKEIANKLREKLSLLWDRLCVSPHDREKFNESHRGLGMKTINGLQEEIIRYEELKRVNLKQLVKTAREEIVRLRQKCIYVEEDGLQFCEFETTNYTEELLELHEQEVKRLQTEVESSEKVRESLDRWNELFEKQMEFDEKADPERLFANRGGQLLKEEKERKAIQKELPKVESNLKKIYKEWCETHGKTGKCEGEEIMKYIEKKWLQYHARKEEKKLERKRAKEIRLQEEAFFGVQVGGAKRKDAKSPASKLPAGKSPCLEPVRAKSPMRSTDNNGDSKVINKDVNFRSPELPEDP